MKPISRSDFRAALQQAASETAASFLRDHGLTISISETDHLLCKRWMRDWCPLSTRMPPNGGWDWSKIHERTAYSRDEFTIAICDDGGALCGLVMMKIVKSAVRVVALEGDPSEAHSLKRLIIGIALELALRLAKHLDREFVRLMEPAPGLVPLYERVFGYTLVQPKDAKPYCERRVP